MSKTVNQIALNRAATRTLVRLNLKWFSWLLIVALGMMVFPACADEPEDVYLRIYAIVQQADALNSSGQTAQALAKYREAHKALLNFQHENPQWNKKVVSFRLNDVVEKVTALSQKTSAPAGGSQGAKQDSTSSEKEPTPAPSSPSAKAVGTPQVKLIEAGAEPRKVLRLHPKPGDKQTLGMTMNMAMEMKMGESEIPPIKMPAIKMTMDATVKSVSPEGDITYEMSMSDASVADDPNVMPQIAEALKSAFGGMKGTSGTGMISNRGVGKGTELKAPTGASPQVSQVMDQMRESFSTLSASLPEEAVGAGAKWEVQRQIKSQGMTLEQTAKYELLSVEGERFTAKSSIAQHASNQKIENPALPGMKIDVSKMTGNGTCEIKTDLTKVLPSEGTMNLRSDMSMAMDMGGQKQAMNMKLDLDMRLATK